jgi:hypothetical protein
MTEDSMATAREVRAAVRAQITEQINARQDAALAVAAGWSKVEKARERVITAEIEMRDAVVTALETVPVTDLAALTGIPAADLRRITRTAKTARGAAANGAAATNDSTAVSALAESVSTAQ